MADLINYDYKIITIDSDCSTFLNSNICDFYITLDEPLRNVYKINIITILINIPNNSPINTTLNPIYINFNNYNRIISKKKTISDGNRGSINVFDSIIIENPITDVNGSTTLKNDYYNNDSIFCLNPIEPQLVRFSIKLLNIDNNIINKNDINRFIMKIGVYYNNKKTTRV